jgi:hypothetical protein
MGIMEVSTLSTSFWILARYKESTTVLGFYTKGSKREYNGRLV